MVIVKICGLTTFEDALFAAENGADMIGLNFYSKSRRYVSTDQAQKIADGLRAQLGAGCPLLVGLFVNEAVGVISAVMRKVGLPAVQLSGDESAEMIAELRGVAYKAIRPVNAFQAEDDAAYYSASMPTNPRLPSMLIDAHVPGEYGGTGTITSDDLALLVRDRVPRLMLAGGLTPDNVAARIATVNPWAVDVASGIESSGVKDHAKIRDFIQAARAT